MPKFSDEIIVRLFGEAEAEREDPARLLEYFVKNDVYTKVKADLKLRVLVGYKGVGKSALFKICELEDEKAGVTSIWIKLDDVAGIPSSNDLNVAIKEWKQGIQEIIFRKVAEEFGRLPEESEKALVRFGNGLLQSLINLANSRLGEITNPAKKSLVSQFVTKGKLVVYLDDLDRGWTGKDADIVKIAALLNAVRDIIAETKGIYFRIALRSDVYSIVRKRDSNTDKIEGDTVWLQWNNDDIFRVLVRRVAAFEGKILQFISFGTNSQGALAASYLDSIFEKKYHGIGMWENAPMHHIILSFVRAKPRDIVLFCSGAAKNAARHKHEKIMSSDVTESLRGYCQGRINDLVNEFRSELPDVERLIYGMKASQREIKEGKGNKYTTDEFVKKLKDISSQGKFKFYDGKEASPTELLRFLFKITFITARKKTNTGYIERKYYDEASHLSTHYADFGYDWEIHPAYRWALDQDTSTSLSRQVELTDISEIPA